MKYSTNKHIYTEDLDYSQTSNASIWGDGDPETLEVLKELATQNTISGYWLHFAAGDGRYNNILLSQADRLLATDIDVGALEKLKKTTPVKLLDKLSIQEQDITQPFSFADNTFDGVFNTGTLHLFPSSVLETIFSEVSRVMKDNGSFIFDFATDVQRIKPDGSFVGRSETEYTKAEGKKTIIELLKANEFKYELIACEVPPEEVTAGEGTYMFSCNYWLVLAEKTRNKHS